MKIVKKLLVYVIFCLGCTTAPEVNAADDPRVLELVKKGWSRAKATEMVDSVKKTSPDNPKILKLLKQCGYSPEVKTKDSWALKFKVKNDRFQEILISDSVNTINGLEYATIFSLALITDKGKLPKDVSPILATGGPSEGISFGRIQLIQTEESDFYYYFSYVPIESAPQHLRNVLSNAAIYTDSVEASYNKTKDEH